LNKNQGGSKEALFSQVSDAEERIKIWEKLVIARSSIRLYSEKGDHPVFDSLVLNRFSKKELVFSGLPKGLDLAPINQSLITFVVEEVRFFAQLEPTHELSRGELRVPLPNSVFKVNRRANFRVSTPQNHTFVVSMLALNGQAKEQPLQLRDLSFGGCCLYYPDEECPLEEGDVIEMRLQLDSRMVVKTGGNIRYGRPANETKKGWLVGVQFHTNAESGSGDLFSMVLSLYRRTQSYGEI
jgi:hypothetical protein